MNNRKFSTKVTIKGKSKYQSNEEVYENDSIDKEIDPENVNQRSNLKTRIRTSANNEKSFEDDESGDDLDIPGSELDDEEEEIGSEDEENNFYSIGGENHDNLEEDNGD